MSTLTLAKLHVVYASTKRQPLSLRCNTVTHTLPSLDYPQCKNFKIPRPSLHNSNRGECFRREPLQRHILSATLLSSHNLFVNSSNRLVNRTSLSVSKSTADTLTLTPTMQRALSNKVHNDLEATTVPRHNASRYVAEKWMEYQGIADWEGLLDPLDRNLRREILRYGGFVEAAYESFEFDPLSPSFGTCRHPKRHLFDRCGLPETGYRITKNLTATSGIRLPRWTEKAPGWVTAQSSWIGYVAVCQDKEQIDKLGRRDVVISLRGTATLLEWLENLRATLAPMGPPGGPMVETGFLSLYTTGNRFFPSLQEIVRREITRLLESYGGEPLSLTITGHSLGAALATLAAYDIKTTFVDHAPMVTVISFGGPRVGNRSFRRQLEEQGTKVLRIVNSDDVITKVPGFVIDSDDVMSRWIGRRVEDTQWAYAEVGTELRLSSKDSLRLGGINVARCHELKTYLHLVKELESSTCPLGLVNGEICSPMI